MKDILNKQLLAEIQSKFGQPEQIPADMQDLFQQISRTYAQFEQDQSQLKQLMELRAKELKASYEQLAAQAQLQKVNKELEEFVYIASHDLREPLRSIKSFAQILSMKLDQELSPDDLELFKFITDGVKRMETLLNDLLTFAKIGDKDQQLEIIDLNDILSAVLKNLRVRIEENEAEIIADRLPIIKAAPTQMQQLLQNLIGNAIKFRGQHSPVVKIQVNSNEQYHIISVEDNGIGIDPAYTTKVFKVFQRLNARSAYDGSGIGLSICQKIINNLNGQIWLESKVDQGTTFYFSIPVMAEVLVS